LPSKFLYTVDETANSLSVGRTVVYQLLNARELESVKIGRARRVVHSSIEAYIEKLRQQLQSEDIR
jgi:excisionase family DNA binding protein